MGWGSLCGSREAVWAMFSAPLCLLPVWPSDFSGPRAVALLALSSSGLGLTVSFRPPGSWPSTVLSRHLGQELGPRMGLPGCSLSLEQALAQNCTVSSERLVGKRQAATFGGGAKSSSARWAELLRGGSGRESRGIP